MKLVLKSAIFSVFKIQSTQQLKAIEKGQNENFFVAFVYQEKLYPIISTLVQISQLNEKKPR